MIECFDVVVTLDVRRLLSVNFTTKQQFIKMDEVVIKNDLKIGLIYIS